MFPPDDMSGRPPGINIGMTIFRDQNVFKALLFLGIVQGKILKLV
jgi:hypothetical protein